MDFSKVKTLGCDRCGEDYPEDHILPYGYRTYQRLCVFCWERIQEALLEESEMRKESREGIPGYSGRREYD